MFPSRSGERQAHRTQKSATVLVQGEYAYGYLKGEAGVHRLILLVPPPFDAGEIQRSGRLLSARSGAGSA